MCQRSVSLTTSGHSSDSNQQQQRVSLIQQQQQPTAPLQQVQIQLLDDSNQEFSVALESQAILERNNLSHYWTEHPTKPKLTQPEISIGKALHEKYVEKYGTKNVNTREQKSKHGVPYKAKVYQRKDLGLLLEVLREFYDEKQLK
jgi:hypothetical protein